MHPNQHSDFSEPLSKRIFRRLKNPRIWVWQAVIVAVVVLLMVYNPDRNLNQNAAPKGDADRSIAMTTKSGDTAPSSEPTSFRAAPSPATVEMDALDVKIVRETSVRRVRAVRRSGRGRQRTKPSAPKRPAQDRADLAKKSNESAAFGDKLTAEDMPKAALKSAGRDYVSRAASSPSPAAPAAGIMPQGQAQSLSGGTRMAKTANANKSLSEIQPSEPPAEKQAEQQPADQFKAKAQATEELIVVHCEITPEALKNHAFDKLLADNSIVWSDANREIPLTIICLNWITLKFVGHKRRSDGC